MSGEDRFTPPSALCPRPDLWTSRDIEATEFEVLELVGSLVRALQPDLVVETGTYLGDGTRAIAAALDRNGHGHVHTFELDPGIVGKAAESMPEELVGRVTFHEGKAEDWTPPGHIDFAFFDSSPGSRVMEWLRLSMFMSERTVVAFHDTAPHLPLRQMLNRPDVPPLVLVDLPTPRGISIGQLPRE